VARPPLPAQPTRLSVPAVGLDATVGAMSVAAGGSVDPPTPGSAYWLSGSSVAGPTSTGTTYLAGHTYRGGGRAVFNPFLDIPHSRYTVHKGDRIVVGTPSGSWAYTVTDTELYLKTTVEQQTELWRNVPGRLVLVTCFQYDGGTSSQQNFVVYAQLDR
jgi:sortase (surface protein transpeptidase)